MPVELTFSCRQDANLGVGRLRLERELRRADEEKIRRRDGMERGAIPVQA